MDADWETTFFDGTDDSGSRYGVVMRRRLIATAPCIGCRLHETEPENAASQTYEVWVNGEREADDVGCFCDQQAEGQVTPWRVNPLGTLRRDLVCPECAGHGVNPIKLPPLYRERRCASCDGTGWKDQPPPRP